MTNFQNLQTQDMNLVLSTDAKPRLKWTPELHQRFVEAVHQLGGADSCVSFPSLYLPYLVLHYFSFHGFCLIFFLLFLLLSRGNTERSDESDGNTRTYFVSSQESFTGNSSPAFFFTLSNL